MQNLGVNKVLNYCQVFQFLLFANRILDLNKNDCVFVEHVNNIR